MKIQQLGKHQSVGNFIDSDDKFIEQELLQKTQSDRKIDDNRGGVYRQRPMTSMGKGVFIH
jgi:hypothetical protein